MLCSSANIVQINLPSSSESSSVMGVIVVKFRLHHYTLWTCSMLKCCILVRLRCASDSDALCALSAQLFPSSVRLRVLLRPEMFHELNHLTALVLFCAPMVSCVQIIEVGKLLLFLSSGCLDTIGIFVSCTVMSCAWADRRPYVGWWLYSS